MTNYIGPRQNFELHLKGIFLSFQKIIKMLTLDQLYTYWRYGCWKIPTPPSTHGNVKLLPLNWTHSRLLPVNWIHSRERKLLLVNWTHSRDYCRWIEPTHGGIHGTTILANTFISPYQLWWYHLKGLFLSFQKICIHWFLLAAERFLIKRKGGGEWLSTAITSVQLIQCQH